MANFVIFRKSRNALSSFLHIFLNIILGIVSIYITYATKSWAIGIVLVLLSKWRIFAVRPRFWFLNLKSNLVDLIVGISIVMIAYASGPTLLPVHFILAILYTLWLVILKPLSSERATGIQALTAVFLGFTALVLMAASINSVVMVLIAFIISYGAARHILVQSDDSNYELIPLVCGLISAEIAWLCQSWLIVYSFSSVGIIIPQLSIIVTVVAYLFGYVYKSILRHEGKLDWTEVTMPVVFSVLLISIIVLWFSNPIFNV